MTVYLTALADAFTRVDELVQWLTALDRPFAFLLALPFWSLWLGLVGEFVRQRR